MARKASVSSTAVDVQDKELLEVEEVATTKTTTTPKDKEKDDLKAQNAMLSEALELLKAQIAEMKSAPIVIQQTKNADNTRFVKIINVQPFAMPIQTSDVSVILDGFGKSHSVRFVYMNDVITKYMEWLKDGRIILDKESDYEDLGIGYIYQEVMNINSVNDIVSFKAPDAVNTILSLDGDTREIFERLIARSFLDGVFSDYNYIRELDKNGCKIQKFIDKEELDGK